MFVRTRIKERSRCCQKCRDPEARTERSSQPCPRSCWSIFDGIGFKWCCVALFVLVQNCCASWSMQSCVMASALSIKLSSLWLIVRISLYCLCRENSEAFQSTFRAALPRVKARLLQLDYIGSVTRTWRTGPLKLLLSAILGDKARSITNTEIQPL